MYFTRAYSDVSNNRTGTAIYCQKIFLPIRSYYRHVFRRLRNIFNLYAYSFWKNSHPVRILKTVGLLEGRVLRVHFFFHCKYDPDWQYLLFRLCSACMPRTRNSRSAAPSMNEFAIGNVFFLAHLTTGKKEVSTKLWYSTIGRLATRWLSPFSGVARACAYAHMIFTAVSKRDTVS